VRIDLEYEFTLDSIKAFFHQMAELDAERVHRVLATRPTGIQADDRVLAERISLTLYEVLSQRRLLSDFRVLRVFSKVRGRGQPRYFVWRRSHLTPRAPNTTVGVNTTGERIWHTERGPTARVQRALPPAGLPRSGRQVFIHSFVPDFIFRISN
jgi:hypothetical protein